MSLISRGDEHSILLAILLILQARNIERRGGGGSHTFPRSQRFSFILWKLNFGGVGPYYFGAYKRNVVK